MFCLAVVIISCMLMMCIVLFEKNHDFVINKVRLEHFSSKKIIFERGKEPDHVKIYVLLKCVKLQYFSLVTYKQTCDFL